MRFHFYLFLVVFSLSSTLGLPTEAKSKKRGNPTYDTYNSLVSTDSEFRVFARKNKKHMTKEELKLLEQKTKSDEREKIGVNYRAKQIHFSAKKKVVTFEVIDEDEDLFKVNGKKVILPDEESPEEIWKRIQAVLPQDKSSLIDLILPRAFAASSSNTLIAGLAFVTVNASQGLGCGNWRDALKSCNTAYNAITEKKGNGRYEIPVESISALREYHTTVYDEIGHVYLNESKAPRRSCGGKKEDAQGCRERLERIVIARFDDDGQSHIDQLSNTNDVPILYNRRTNVRPQNKSGARN